MKDTIKPKGKSVPISLYNIKELLINSIEGPRIEDGTLEIVFIDKNEGQIKSHLEIKSYEIPENYSAVFFINYSSIDLTIDFKLNKRRGFTWSKLK
jgi:hypothetical protein